MTIYRESLLALKKRIDNLEKLIIVDPKYVGHHHAAHTQRSKYHLYIKQRGRCCFCRVKMYADSATYKRSKQMATIEHITPRSMGGKDVLSNYALSCTRCNSYRGCIEFNKFKARCDLLISEGRLEDVYKSKCSRKRENAKMKKDDMSCPRRQKFMETLNWVFLFLISREVVS